MKRTWQCIGLTLLLFNPRILLAKVNYRQRYNYRRYSPETKQSIDSVKIRGGLYRDKHHINRQEVRRETNQSEQQIIGTPSIPTNSIDSSNIVLDMRPIQKSYSTRKSMKMKITPSPSISPYPTGNHVSKQKSKSKSGKGGMKNKKPTCPPIVPVSPLAPAPALRPTNNPITTPLAAPQPSASPVAPPPVQPPTTAPVFLPSPVLSTTLINSWSFSPSTQSISATPSTASPIQPPMSPVVVPVVSSTNPLMAPVSAPVVLPSSSIPIAPTPTSGTPVMASPFAVNYSPPSSTASINDFQAATDLTCAHMEQYLVDNFDLSPFIILEDVICSSNGTTTTPTTISFIVTPIFGGDLSLIPSQSSIDELIRVAFLVPAVTSLITALNSLPTNNPFSVTTGVVYDNTAPLLVVQSVGTVWKTTDLFDASNKAITTIAPSPANSQETMFPTSSNSIASSYSGSIESSYASVNDLKSNEKGKGMRQKQSKSPQPISCSPATSPTIITLYPSSKSKMKMMKMGKGMNISVVPSIAPRPTSCPPTKIPTTAPITSTAPNSAAPVSITAVPVTTTMAPIPQIPTTTGGMTSAPINAVPVSPTSTTVAPFTTSPVTTAPVLSPIITNVPVTSTPVLMPVPSPLVTLPLPTTSTTASPGTAPVALPVTAAPILLPITTAPIVPLSTTTTTPVSSAPVLFPGTAAPAPVVMPVMLPTNAPIVSIPIPTAPFTTPAPINIPITSGIPVTLSPVLLVPVPVSTPTTIITAAPMNTPIALPVTLSPVLLAPVPVPVPLSVPIPGIYVQATPFNVMYTPTSAPITPIDFISAIDLTCTHVEESLRTNIGPNPFISLVDVTCTSVSTTTTPVAAVSFDVVVIFSLTSSMVLTTNDTNVLLEVAFLPPSVTNLINDLRTLPASNPLSTVTSVVYSTAPAPIRAPFLNLTTSVSSNDNMVQINGSYLFSVSGIAGILLLFFTAMVQRCRSVQGTNSKTTLNFRPENHGFWTCTLKKSSLPDSSTIHVSSQSSPSKSRGVLIDSNRTHRENRKTKNIINLLSSRHDEYIATSIDSKINDIDPLLQLSSSSSPFNRRKKLVL